MKNTLLEIENCISKLEKENEILEINSMVLGDSDGVIFTMISNNDVIIEFLKNELLEK